MEFRKQVILAPFTTFKIGGPAAWFYTPSDGQELAKALRFAKEQSIPFFCLGGGSNVLIHDSGFDGLVIHLTAMNSIRREGEELICGAGAPVTSVTRTAAENGLSGMEFAGGLPGSIGGAAYMNARAYGSSMEDILHSVKAVSRDGKIITIKAEEMDYGYKKSRLMESGETAFEIRLHLESGDRDTIAAETARNREKRVSMGQFSFPNAGCIFKNDYSTGIPSGKLIDQCGLLGTRLGGAAVFEKHGNFIINRDNASAEEIRDLIEKIRKTVLTEKGIRLEEEIRYLGFPETGNPAENRTPE